MPTLYESSVVVLQFTKGRTTFCILCKKRKGKINYYVQINNELSKPFDDFNRAFVYLFEHFGFDVNVSYLESTITQTLK